MADKIGLGNKIKKVEKNSLQKFKNQNKVLKKFGKAGLKVYRAIRKKGISIQELMEKTSVKQDALFEILLFLKEKKMIDTVGKIEEPQVDKETEMVVPEGPMGDAADSPAKKEAQKTPPATIAPEGEVVSEEEMKEKMKGKIEPEEEATLAPSAEIEEPPEEEVSPEDEFGISKEREIEADTEEELPPLKEEPLGEITEEVISAEESDDAEILPLELGGKESKEEEFPALEKGPAEEDEEENVAPEEDEDIVPQESQGGDDYEEEEDDEDIFLTPGERKIKAQYGQVGIDVYNLIDGQRTAEEIMKTTGVTETTLIEMLDFMEKKGIIKLEHPGARKGAGTKKPALPAAKEIGFAPMVEEKGMPLRPLGGDLGKQFTLEVPSKVKGNMFKSMQMKANLMIKYRQPGVNAYQLINGSRDAVEIALKTSLPLYRVYKILNYLEKEGMVRLAPATREEIKRKYGEDGYSVYKKYGREGVMLYQLIGKDMDLREMALQTSQDKQRVVKIFMFIHRLLGIDLPIDEDVLLERLKSIPEAPKK